LVRARVGDAVVLEEVFARWRIEAVFHFAAASRVGESVADPLAYYRCNMVEGLTLLECVVRHGRVPFVFSSSASVYGVQERVPIPEDAPLRPVSPYAETKRAFEAALEWAGRAYGLPWVALRYFNAAGAEGPWEPKAEETHLIPLALQAARGGPPLTVYGTDYPTRDGTAERDYVHVGDLAEGHLAALAHLEAGGASGPFNLGSGRGHTVAEVLAVVEAVTGRPVPRVLAARRPGDPASSVADPARARAVLGWEARRSDLRRIVQDAWEAMRRVREEGRA
jgi:UDP-arabinose 4-epimerase